MAVYRVDVLTDDPDSVFEWIEANVPTPQVVRVVAYDTVKGHHFKCVFRRQSDAELFHRYWHPDAENHVVEPFGIATQPLVPESYMFEGRNGTALFERRWRPSGTPKAVVALIHGSAEHAGRYEHVAAHLTDAGYAVAAFDLRGHGRSGGPRLYVRSFEAYLGDVDIFAARTRAAWPGLPVFLLGHSMGGTVATLYALDHQDALAGLILSGPALQAGEDFSPLKIALVKALGQVVPRLPVQKLEAGHISRDPAVVERYDADPLVYRGWIRAGMGVALIRALEAVEAREATLRLPLLLLHGTADSIIDVAGTKRLYREAASTDKTLLLYEGFYHEVFNEPERERVLRDVRQWLDAHVDGEDRT